MNDKKDQTIGIRFSKKEREIIEIYAKNRNYTLTEFIRKAVFSHMNELHDNVGILNSDEINNNLKSIQESAELIIKNIQSLSKKFELDYLEENDKVSFNSNKYSEKVSNL